MCINNTTAGIFFWRPKNFFATSKIFLYISIPILFYHFLKERNSLYHNWYNFHFSRSSKINYLSTQASPRNGENPLPAFVHCVHHPACRQVTLSGWGVLPRAKRWQVRSPNSSVLWLSRQQSHCCLYVGIPPANVLFLSILIETHWRFHKNRNYCF